MRHLSHRFKLRLLALLGVAILVTPVWNYNSRTQGIQSLSETYQRQIWNRAKVVVLQDWENRISDDFSVDADLKKRVSFWFDIYGAYEDHHKVIHHSLYPWLVYEVVDARNIKNIDSYMKKRVRLYKGMFRTLRKKSKFKAAKLSRVEQAYLDLMDKASDPLKALKTASFEIRYQTGQRNLIQDGFERSQPFLKAMEAEFEKRNLPTELTRLPFVESSFHLQAKSRVGAVGIWQFMRRTGRKFLKINRRYDERLSPLKSTVAAAKLLKQNHRILYKEWPLALTAYNYGPSGLRRAVKKHGRKDLAYIIETNPDDRFSFASSNFYSCFLAILHVEKYKDILFPDQKFETGHPELAKIKIKKRIRARTLVKTMDLTKKEFLHLNPDFRNAVHRNYKLPRGYEYYRPIKSDNRFALDDHLQTTKVN